MNPSDHVLCYECNAELQDGNAFYRDRAGGFRRFPDGLAGDKILCSVCARKGGAPLPSPVLLVPFSDQELDHYCLLAEKGNPRRATRDPEGFGYCSAELLTCAPEFFPRLRLELQRLYAIEQKFLEMGLAQIAPADLVQIDAVSK